MPRTSLPAWTSSMWMTVESTLLGAVIANGTVAGELRFSDFKSRREDMAISF